MSIVDPSRAFLCSTYPALDDVTGNFTCWPSQWMTAGYVPRKFADGSTGWQKLDRFQVAMRDRRVSAAEVFAFYHLPTTRSLLRRLADTFAPFFPLSAEQWETDLRRASSPIVLACLWQTTADEFDYYTKGKQFSLRARREYLDTLWLFFNHGSEVAGYQERAVCSLTLGRIQRVAAELERYFQRRTHSCKPLEQGADLNAVGESIHPDEEE